MSNVTTVSKNNNQSKPAVMNLRASDKFVETLGGFAHLVGRALFEGVDLMAELGRYGGRAFGQAEILEH